MKKETKQSVWTVTEADSDNRSWANDSGVAVLFASLDKAKAVAWAEEQAAKWELEKDDELSWWDGDSGCSFLQVEETELS